MQKSASHSVSAVHLASCSQKLSVVCCSWSMVSSSWESPPSRLEVSPWLGVSASVNGEVSASSSSCQYANINPRPPANERVQLHSTITHQDIHAGPRESRPLSTSFLYQYTAFSRRALVCLSFSRESSNCRPLVALVSSFAALSNSRTKMQAIKQPNKRQLQIQTSRCKRQSTSDFPMRSRLSSRRRSATRNWSSPVAIVDAATLSLASLPVSSASPLKIRYPCRVHEHQEQQWHCLSHSNFSQEQKRPLCGISLFIWIR